MRDRKLIPWMASLVSLGISGYEREVVGTGYTSGMDIHKGIVSFETNERGKV